MKKTKTTAELLSNTIDDNNYPEMRLISENTGIIILECVETNELFTVERNVFSGTCYLNKLLPENKQKREKMTA